MTVASADGPGVAGALPIPPGDTVAGLRVPRLGGHRFCPGWERRERPAIDGIDGAPGPEDARLRDAYARDVGAGLQRICRRVADQLGLSGAVVTLMTRSGAEAVAAVSDETLREVENLQFSLGEGPGREAFETGRPVLTSDLESATARWPGYARAAFEAGVGAVHVFPLQLGASRFGVLILYASGPRTLTGDEAGACVDFAAQATDVLLEGDRGQDAHLDPTLESSLNYRSEVYQAQGLVMIDLGISLVDALARMRAHAFAKGMELDHLAAEIIMGVTRLEADNG